MVLYAAAAMARVRETAKERAYQAGPEPRLTERLKLSSVYCDREDQGVYRYRVQRPVAGFGVSAAAGLFSGLLGVGGGFIKVPAMNILMRVPMKAAVATSNFMIGVTAAASAFIYYSQGLVDPGLAAMVIIGVFSGTNLGTRLLEHSKASNVRFVLVAMTGRPIPERSIPPRSLGDQLYHFTPEGYLSLGVLILIFTPVVRVLLSLLSFVKEGDRMYVLMTLIVFVNLITSLFLLA